MCFACSLPYNLYILYLLFFTMKRISDLIQDAGFICYVIYNFYLALIRSPADPAIQRAHTRVLTRAMTLARGPPIIS